MFLNNKNHMSIIITITIYYIYYDINKSSLVSFLSTDILGILTK